MNMTLKLLTVALLMPLVVSAKEIEAVDSINVETGVIIIWWRGNPIDRQSQDFYNFISAAYLSMFQQNERFRTALMSTRGMTLYHTRGEQNPYKTILTEREFCQILTELRDNYDKRDKHLGSIKIVFEEDGTEDVEG